ncbi:NAD(+)/NADH kinase [Haloterrigena salifodinae]|uniref:NAD(+)/NADH kinase n=1 Tax=Haloterrigena salifodinae TaxID=2675099 RepID=A0A8T8E1A4_9EURY|nr:NAD(+)/NADH kinase [Haloterrigena salifodinae]QRV15604.1 NAD(+)/NADH kinase [Haloterrigena salifodinae]
MTRVGLIANPAAGRDIRRLTGGASVVDNYAKRRVAECVLEGLAVVAEPPDVAVMPDRSGIADHAVSEAPDDLAVERVEMTVEESAADTRRAAARFRESADAVVVLGGDGTTRDVALEIGDVPVVSVSTGTNNVVPTPVDGTVAGAAAAAVATGAADADTVTDRHGRIDVRADDVNGEKRLTGLAAVEITDRSFVGTRAVIDPSELVGVVVSRAHPSDIGLGSVAGCLEPLAPDAPGGVALRLDDPEATPRSVSAIVAPGMTATIGIEERERLDWDEPATFDVSDGVVGADGERELEVVDATVEMTPTADGPRLVDVDAALGAAVEADALVREGPLLEER